MTLLDGGRLCLWLIHFPFETQTVCQPVSVILDESCETARIVSCWSADEVASQFACPFVLVLRFTLDDDVRVLVLCVSVYGFTLYVQNR